MQGFPRLMATLSLACLLAGGPAAAQDAYPTGPVKFIIPFAAGGSTDIIGRLFGQKLSEAWGKPVIAENRIGAGGVIGAEAVARAAPDGHTILLGTIGTHGVSTSLIKNLPFHPERDFTPVTLLAILPNILAVNPDVPVKELKDLIAYLKANPGKMSYASGGNGTGSHIAGEYFKSLAGVDVVHVPYKGSSPALVDVMAGRVAYTFDYLPSTLPYVRSGKLRGVAVTGPKRSRAAPDLPTAIEAGLPAFNVLTWYAIYAPANTPRPIVDNIRNNILKISQMPDVIKTMDGLGVEMVVSTPAELASFQHAEIERWSKLIKDANITAQ